MDVETALKEAMSIDGSLGAALVDRDSGMPLGTMASRPVPLPARIAR